MKKKLIYALLFIAFTLSSCEKGDTGPQGPVGPQGPQGNANVSSFTVSVASGDWIQLNPIYYVDLPAPNITQAIVDKGTVQIFMESTTQLGVWLSLPWITTHGTWFNTINFNYATGAVRVSSYDSDNTQTANPGLRTFKIVAIAGSIIRDNPDVDITNYQELKARFNLQD